MLPVSRVEGVEQEPATLQLQSFLRNKYGIQSSRPPRGCDTSAQTECRRLDKAPRMFVVCQQRHGKSTSRHTWNFEVNDKRQVIDKNGERGRNRTFNLLIKSQLLCQLSYAP